MDTGLVSCEWLRSELGLGGGAPASSDAPPLRVVDATWFLPNSPFAAPEGSKGAAGDYLEGPRLPGARFFDIDGVSSEDPKGLPHMLPDEATFSAAMAALGIEPSTRVVVYDRHGIFSAPRLWFTLKVAFEHPGEVAVLDGGLPRWQELGYPVETGPPPEEAPAPASSWQLSPEASWDLARVRANLESREALVVDARPKARFEGAAAEPRPGCRSGHVPGSRSLPFLELLTEARTMRPPEELREQILKAGIPLERLMEPGGGNVVASCGSGLTACLVGLGLHRAGVPLGNWSIYDGSWAEYGTDSDAPVATGPAE